MATYRVFYCGTDGVDRSMDATAPTWEEARYAVSRGDPVALFGAGKTEADREAAVFGGAVLFTASYLGKTYDDASSRVVTPADAAPPTDYANATVVEETIFGQSYRRIVSGLSSDYRQYRNSAERAKAGLDAGSNDGNPNAYPEEIPNLVLRLTAKMLMQRLNDNDVVTTWPTSGGIMGAATALGVPRLQIGGKGGASINGVTVVACNDSPDGGFQLGNATLNFTAGMTVLMVTKPASATLPASATFLQLGSTNAGDLRYMRSTNTTSIRLRTSFGNYTSSVAAFVANAPMSIGFTIASGIVGATVAAQHYKGGVALGAAGSANVLATKFYNQNLISGVLGAETMAAIRASLAEVVLYNRILTSAEIGRIQNNWNLRYGV